MTSARRRSTCTRVNDKRDRLKTMYSSIVLYIDIMTSAWDDRVNSIRSRRVLGGVPT